MCYGYGMPDTPAVNAFTDSLRNLVPAAIDETIDQIDDLETLRWFADFHRSLAEHCDRRIAELEGR